MIFNFEVRMNDPANILSDTTFFDKVEGYTWNIETVDGVSSGTIRAGVGIDQTYTFEFEGPVTETGETPAYRFEDGALIKSVDYELFPSLFKPVTWTGTGLAIEAPAANRLLEAFVGDDIQERRDAVFDAFANVAFDLIGSDGADTVGGLDNADVMRGRGGDDELSGGGGGDRLIGQAGDDTLSGGDGADTLKGGRGDDVLFGDLGEDTMVGGRGGDEFFGGHGKDRVLGGAGNDSIFGGLDDDTGVGGKGSDSLFGGNGDDNLRGSSGNDAVIGDDGDDVVIGGGGSDVLDGDRGRDTLSGQQGSDTLDGGAGRDVLNGGGGDDFLDGGGGADTLFGLRGDDTLAGGGGRDTFVFRARDGDDVIDDFRPGRDLIEIRSGAESVRDLTLDRVDGDAVVSFARTTITFDGVAPAELSPDDVIFT